ncbi:hypothetical protein HRI_004228100 [Hibiscus trionum]|uniref:NAC domain-containing protein n=1 Tax=Hibiscus trionum TaxID=183268 RepID=A0A9W7MKN7_HIBTR|nr:hypothetical protein HRI_004228100 [Hibiscus trionum]
MAENSDNQNMAQNFSGAARHGVTNAGGGEIFSTPQGIYYQTTVRNSSAAPNINPAAPEDGENATADEDDDFCSKLVGYRFVPTDQELVGYYLMKKVNGEPLPPNDYFHETNIYDSDPSQLSQSYKQSDGGKEWYFFSPRNKKYPKGGRPNRETGNRVGFWKVTGVNKAVTLDGTVIGCKSNLDFYLRRDSKIIKTNWKMHEYQVNKDSISTKSQIQPFGDMMLDKCVLCKIYLTRAKKGGTDKESEDEDHSLEACSSGQDVNEPPPTTPDNSSRRDYRGKSLMAASNDTNKRARILAPAPLSSHMPTYASYNRNSNANFSPLPTDRASLMPNSSKQCVGGASSTAVNNNPMYASQSQSLFMDGVSPHWVPMAGSYEQAINEAQWIPGNNNTMYASRPECRNPMAGNNNTMYASTPECRNPNPMVGNNNTMYASTVTPECRNPNPMAGNNNTVSAFQNPLMEVVTAYRNPNTYSPQVVNGASPMTGSYQQAINRAHSMAGNNTTAYNIETAAQNQCFNASYQNQYSNASHFQQDFNGATPMAAGNYENEYSEAYPFQNDVNGAFSTEGLNENQYFWQPCPDLVFYGESDGGNFGYVQVQHPNATSTQPTVSDETRKKKGSATQPTQPTQPEEEEEDENSGGATQPSADFFEGLDCYMDPID